MVLRRATKAGDECDVHEWRRYLLWHRSEVRAVKRRTNRRERRAADRDVRDYDETDPTPARDTDRHG